MVVVIVTGGYISIHEFKKRGRATNNPNLTIKYTVFTFQSTLWLRRINTYLLSGLFEFLNNLKLKKYYKSSFDYLWLTGGDIVIRKSFLKSTGLLKGKTIIELSEYQNINESQNHSGNVFQNKRSAKYSKITREALNHIDYFAIMTKTLLEYYKGLTKNKNAKFIHLPMTVDLDRFSKPLPLLNEFKSPYIAFVGVMNDAKDGVNILIEAFSKITNNFPNYNLYLVGSWGYDTPRHKKMIIDLNLEDKVFWMGEHEKGTIPAIIKNAALLVLSRPDSKQAQGGFPTKLGEYLATGNPVCATTVGEIPDYLTDGESVYFAEPGSVDSFANAMQRALSNPEEAKRIGVNGRKVAETHFNKDIQAKILYDFLKENLQTNKNK